MTLTNTPRGPLARNRTDLRATRGSRGEASQRLVLALGAAAALAAFGAPDAEAKKKGRGERVDLVRAEGTEDLDASGSIEMRTARRGPDAVLRVRNLEPRTDYLVVDGTTGDTLGTLDTNRRGRGRFTFGARAGRGNRAGNSGSDADVPDNVEVVDPATGETVLEGDVPDDGEERDYDFAFGFDDFSNDAGDFASVALSSFPEWESESIYLSFFPAPTEEDEHGCWCTPFYDFYADTAMGQELPLGVDAAADLSGRAFRIVDAEGDAVIEGTLPEMEEFDYDFPVCPGGEKPGDDPNGDPNGDGGHDGGDDGMDDSVPFRSAKAGDLPNGGVREDPPSDDPDDGSEDLPEFRLEIQGDDGEFVDVGALTGYDPCDFWYWLPEDPSIWEGEDGWNDEWSDVDWMTGNGVVLR